MALYWFPRPFLLHNCHAEWRKSLQSRVFSTFKVASAHEKNEILLGINLDFLSKIYIYIYNITIYNVNSTYAAATPPLTRTRDALLPAPFHLALLLLSCNNITDRALKSAATSTDISFRLAKRDNARYLSITIAQVKATGVSR